MEYAHAFDRLLEEFARAVVPGATDFPWPEIQALRRRLEDLGDLTGLKDFLEVLAGRLSDTQTLDKAWTFNALGQVCRMLTMHDLAGRYVREGLALLPADHPLRPVLLNTRGNNLKIQFRSQEAHAAFAEAEDLTERLAPKIHLPPFPVYPKPVVQAKLWNNLAVTLLDQCCQEESTRTISAPELETPRRLLDRCLETSAAPARLQVHARLNVAMARLLAGELDAADALLDTLEREIEATPDLWSLRATGTRLRGDSARRRGRKHRAIRLFQDALSWSLRHSNPDEEVLAITSFIDLVQLQAELFATTPDLAAEERLEHLRQLVEQVITLLESKDWYTGRNHARAVAKLSTRLVKAAQAEERAAGTAGAPIDLDMVYVAGLLHDVGKLAVPWALLNKIRPLKPEDREVLERHAPAGGEILRRAGFPEVAAVIEEHHERPDGRGYPHGKREVPLASAAVALADAFEAMITPNRRWRLPKSVEQACAEIEAQSGAQFDPRVVRVLRKVVKVEGVS